MDVTTIPENFNKFEVVLTNPPFGIRSEKSADIGFLNIALNVNNYHVR
jgi:predicted RNA methylase